MSDKRNLSYADFHHEIIKDSDDVIPKHAVGGQQSQPLVSPTSKEDELVRYMSNLPGYLEKGKDFQEKALNVGVLDWKLLEKWRYTQKQTGQTHNGYSPSSSSSSVFSTDDSPSRSTLGQTRSPVQRQTHRVSLQARGALPKDGSIQDAKFYDSGFSMHNPLYRQHKVCGTLPLCKKNDDSEFKTVSKHEVIAPWKGKTKIEGYSTAYKVDNKLSLEIEKKFCGRSSFDKSLPCKVVVNEEQLEPTLTSRYPENVKNPSQTSRKSHYSTNVKMFDGPSRISAPPPMSVPSRRSSCSVPKARNPSPIRRLGSAMGKMIKNAGSRDNSPIRRSSSKDSVPKSNSEGYSVSCSIDSSCSNNSSNNRGRSSPLRRLLDPLLKSRGSNNPESSKKQTSLTIGAAKLSPLSLQALLQVSFKNGLPLFTFAIDNESDILAATVRKLFVPGKGHHYWTYTFFNVHEIKRKSGNWLNNGGRGNNNGHGYVPNVVAQMKVTDSFNEHFIREFNLFGVDVGNGDHFSSDFHPTNELAAIVVKIPRIGCEERGKNGECSYSWLETKTNDETPLFEDMNVSVILPGGVHTVPSRGGEMSTLAQRWRSGGCCDCGGWDLGCQLQVYTSNQRECGRKIGSCSSENKFRLLSLVGQEKQPMLSLAPFKEKIYSVEFNSSLSLLQAFAICLSFLDSKRPSELSEAIHIAQNINNELDVFEVRTSNKPSDHQVGDPIRYTVSYPPPYSPFGRV